MAFFYANVFIISFFLSLGLTYLVSLWATKKGIVDRPDQGRKLHQQAVPLLGGLGIFISFFLVLFFVRDKLLAGNLEYGHWLGFMAGGLVLMALGYLDDRGRLRPLRHILFAVLAAVLVVAGGVEIEKITNPLGGFINFSSFDINIASGLILNPASDFLIIIWLLGMMYTTKLLDGVDGLAGGVTVIGALIIFLFTMTTAYYQPDIGLAALVLAGAALGFLALNWHPARIFLGDGGSLFLGFALGVLAIISGGKIAIALLVMGIPILDVLWTIIRRTMSGVNPFKIADRRHLHFRILDLGLSQKQTAGVYYALSAGFGISVLFLQSRGKLLALGLLVMLMISIVVFFNLYERKKNR